MMRLAFRWLSALSLALVAPTACGVDQRPLVYEYRALGAAGNTASAGNGSAGGSTVDDAGTGGGQPSDVEAGAADVSGGPTGGISNRGGASAMDIGGSPGTAAGGSAGATAGGSTAGGGTAGAITAGSGGAVSPTAGSAGTPHEFPCGDLNGDVVDDCTQTVVQNSRFDSATSNWTAEPSLTQAWDPSNGSGKPGSGSLLLSNTSAVEQSVGAVAVGSRQCIPVNPLTGYDFAARVMLKDGLSTGEAGINVWLFDDNGCQGNLVTGDTPVHGGVADKWTVLQGKLWIPGGVHSMYVRLVAIKPFPKPALSVLIDDVLVAKRQ